MVSDQSLPPAQPAFILRGHTAQIHALHFTHGNSRLLTGDADGWVISWNLAYKRAVASWRAHESAVLGLGSWGHDRIITSVSFRVRWGRSADLRLLTGTGVITSSTYGSYVLR